MKDLPSPNELQAAWEEIQEIHTEYLLPHGVRIPNVVHYTENAKAIWLAALHYFDGQVVDKNTVSTICQRDRPDLQHDQQVRHLKRDGWNLIGRGKHKLDPYKPSTEWINDKVRRENRLNANDFNDLKAAYGNRCATCGAREGRPDPRYGDDLVELQQGHMNPEKNLTLQNAIPQCQFCNRAYRGDFAFDDKGRVRAVADIGPVKRTSDSVKRKIHNWLMEVFG